MGPQGLGLVAYGQAIGGYLNLVIEYGFHLTLTREVARNRSNPDRLSELLAVVWGAKGILCVIAAPLMAAIWLLGRAGDVRLGLSIFAWSAAQSFNLIWYLHGIEKIRLGSALDFGSKLAAMIAIILTVKRPAQLQLVFTWQTVAAVLALLISVRIAYKGNRVSLPTIAGIRNVLRLGWSFFLQRSSSQIYSSGNIVILERLASSVEVGLFSGPDRIVRGAGSLLTPLLYSAYPRISHLAAVSPARGANVAAVTIAVTAAIGALESLVLYHFAPFVVHIALGKGFEGAVPIMAILAFVPFLRSITTAVALQGMLPFGYEHRLAFIYGSTSAAGLILATFAAAKWGAVGTAWIAVAIEASIVIAQVLVLRGARTNPLRSLFSDETLSFAEFGLRRLIGKAK